MIDSFRYTDVDPLCLYRVERHLHHSKRISETLNTNADCPRAICGHDGVGGRKLCAVDEFIEDAYDELCDSMKFRVVEGTVVSDVLR